MSLSPQAQAGIDDQICIGRQVGDRRERAGTLHRSLDLVADRLTAGR